MVADKERDLIDSLLKNSIRDICRENLTHGDSMDIEGILCISFGDDSSQVVVKIREKISNTNSVRLSSDDKNVVILNEFDNNRDGWLKTNNKKPMRFKSFEETITSIIKSEPLENENENEIIDSTRNAIKNVPDSNITTTADTNTLLSPHMLHAKSNILYEESHGNSFGYNGYHETEQPSNATLAFCSRCNEHFEGYEEFSVHNLDLHTLHTCNYCLQTFTSRPNMQRHIRKHTGYTPFICDACGAKFTRKDDYSIHVIKHGVPKPFVCSICGKDYTDRSCLRGHMKREHGQRLLHVCQTCGYGFHDAISVEKHRFVHSGVNLVHCRYCTFTSANEYELSQHLTRHECNEPYYCPECDDNFPTAASYKSHLSHLESLHRTFPCFACSSVFPTLGRLNKHSCQTERRDNSTPRNTDKTLLSVPSSTNFTQRTNEISPIIRPYWCNECGTGFVSERDLNSHINNNHSNPRVCGRIEMPHRKAPLLIDLNMTSSFNNNETDKLKKFSRPLMIELPTLASRAMAIETSHALDLSHKSSSATISNGGEPKSIIRKQPDALQGSPLLTSERYEFSRAAGCFDEPPPLEYATQNGSTKLPDGMTKNTSTNVKYPKKRKCSSLSSVGDRLNNIGNHHGSPGSLSDSQVTPHFNDLFPSGTTTPPDGSTFKLRDYYRCDICRESFTDFTAFSSHSVNDHKRFLCDECGMSFTAKPNRDRHRRYHTGERPYACHLCDMKFFRGDDLKYHRTTRHCDDYDGPLKLKT